MSPFSWIGSSTIGARIEGVSWSATRVLDSLGLPQWFLIFLEQMESGRDIVQELRNRSPNWVRINQIDMLFDKKGEFLCYQKLVATFLMSTVMVII